MKNKQFNRFLSIVMTLVVTSFLISSVMAQSSVKSSSKLERERVGRIMAADANVEEFRVEYLNYLTELQEDMRLFGTVPAIQRQWSQAGSKPISMLTATKNSVSAMSQENLIKMRAVYAKFPGWREAPQALIRPDLRQELQERLKAKIEGRTVTVNAVTPDKCADGISADPSNTDIAAAKTAQIVGEGLMNGSPTDFLTFEAHAAFAVAYAALEGVTLSLETLKAIKDDCTNDSFQADITTKVTTTIPGLISTSTSTTAGNITASTSTTATNITTSTSTTATNIVTSTATTATNITTAKTEIISEILKSKATIIADAHGNKDELKNLLLRTQIEADLSSTDGSAFVALYETPMSVCFSSLDEKGLAQSLTLPGASPVPVIQCGLLELVREIVRQTIANVGAGTNAQSFFNSAVAQQAAGKYKAAYASYRQAYKAAGK